MTEAPPRRSWWLSGTAIAAAIVLATPFLGLIAARIVGYTPFHVPSEAMAPTIRKGDRIIALMHGPADLRRGDVIVFTAPAGDTYLKRVAALAGDRIALRGDIVILNGKPVEQRLEGVEEAAPETGTGEVRRLAEQFPGEARPHRIYDSGEGPFDDFGEQLVQPGHVFVLGDDRDHSADSRVPAEQMGVGQLPLARVGGKVLFHSWFSSKGLGEPI